MLKSMIKTTSPTPMPDIGVMLHFLAFRSMYGWYLGPWMSELP